MKWKMLPENSLTPEKLKTFKGLENLTDQQAAYYCEQINTYAAILIRSIPIEEINASNGAIEQNPLY